MTKTFQIYDSRTHRVVKGNAGTNRPAVVRLAAALDHRFQQIARFRVQ